MTSLLLLALLSAHAPGVLPSLEPARPPHQARPSGDEAEADREDDERDPATPGLDAELAVQSSFAWRGLMFGELPMLQPELEVSWQRFTFSAWAGVPLGAQLSGAPLSTVVPSLSWTGVLDAFEISPEVLLYAASDRAPTLELGVEGAWLVPEIRRLRVEAGVWVDVLRAPGAVYGRAGVEWSQRAGPYTLSLGGYVGLGSNTFTLEYANNDSLLAHVAPRAAVRRDLTEWLWADLHVEGSVLVNPELFASVTSPVLVVGGASVGVSL